MSYDDWPQKLAEFFGTHDVETRWAALLERIRTGDCVTGCVVVKAPFGAWLDISTGFPALIELPHIRGLTPQRYRLDDWCPIGSTLTAVVISLDSTNHQVRLAQVKHAWSEVSPEERLRLERLVAGLHSLCRHEARSALAGSPLRPTVG